MKALITEKDSFEIIAGTTISSVQTYSDNQTKKVEYQTSFDSGNYQVILRGMSKTFSQLILTLITIVAMRFMIKISLTSNKTDIKFIDNTLL
jgi:hypothetical protein